MQISSAFVTLAAVVSAYASCSTLGPGATDTLPGQFTFAAYDASSGTTSPLHILLAYTQPGASYHVLSANTGYGYGYPAFTLSGGVISTTAAPPPNQQLQPARFIGLEAPPAGGPNGIYPTAAPFLLFSNIYSPPPAFCSVPNPTGTDSVLALNGYTNQFSLCESSFTQQLPLTNALLFNASSTAQRTAPNTYDGSSCKPVTVLTLPS